MRVYISHEKYSREQKMHKKTIGEINRGWERESDLLEVIDRVALADPVFSLLSPCYLNRGDKQRDEGEKVRENEFINTISSCEHMEKFKRSTRAHNRVHEVITITT